MNGVIRQAISNLNDSNITLGLFSRFGVEIESCINHLISTIIMVHFILKIFVFCGNIDITCFYKGGFFEIVAGYSLMICIVSPFYLLVLLAREMFFILGFGLVLLLFSLEVQINGYAYAICSACVLVMLIYHMFLLPIKSLIWIAVIAIISFLCGDLTPPIKYEKLSSEELYKDCSMGKWAIHIDKYYRYDGRHWGTFADNTCIGTKAQAEAYAEKCIKILNDSKDDCTYKLLYIRIISVPTSVALEKGDRYMAKSCQY